MDKIKFKVCCEEMKLSINNGGCEPYVTTFFPPILGACDGFLDSRPLKFCPWCGKKIEEIERTPILEM